MPDPEGNLSIGTTYLGIKKSEDSSSIQSMYQLNPSFQPSGRYFWERDGAQALFEILQIGQQDPKIFATIIDSLGYLTISADLANTLSERIRNTVKSRGQLSFSTEELSRIGTFSFRVHNYLDNNKTEVSLRDVIAAVASGKEEQQFAEETMESAKELLNRYLPSWLPSESTTLLVKNKNYQSWDRHPRGIYYGELLGSHYIGVTRTRALFKEKLPVEYDEIGLPFTVAHELMHQGHAERLDDTGILTGFSLNDHYQSVEDLQKAFRRFSSIERIPIHSKANGTLALSLSEGFACWGSIQLLRNEIKMYESRGESELADRLRELVSVTEKYMSLTPDLQGKLPYYTGNKIINRFASLGVDISKLPANINWQKCSEIKFDTQEFEKVLHDPEQILTY